MRIKDICPELKLHEVTDFSISSEALKALHQTFNPIVSEVEVEKRIQEENVAERSAYSPCNDCQYFCGVSIISEIRYMWGLYRVRCQSWKKNVLEEQ